MGQDATGARKKYIYTTHWPLLTTNSKAPVNTAVHGEKKSSLKHTNKNARKQRTYFTKVLKEFWLRVLKELWLNVAEMIDFY